MKGNKCATKRCRNNTEGRELCNTCRSRKARLSDPVKYAYQNLKDNAKRRGVLFTITLEDFRQWCKKVTYIGFSGRNPDSFTIDRKHDDIGYHLDNIQVLTLSENVKKYVSYNWRNKQVEVIRLPDTEAEDLPF